jgi:antitoxin component YwqK of YwqJK toxin-antitoxin module
LGQRLLGGLRARAFGRHLSACSRKELREEKYPNGALKSRGYVKQDAEKNYGRHGSWIFWYENGQKKEESAFKDDKLEGRATFWYENGRKEPEGEYQDVKQSGKRGDTGILKDGRQGVWTFWYPDGQKEAEETYKDGKWEGPVTTWYGNGHKELEGTAIKRIFCDSARPGRRKTGAQLRTAQAPLTRFDMVVWQAYVE